jgi:hypothetical protein
VAGAQHVYVESEDYGRDLRRCWVGSPGPAGFAGQPISVEEAVRFTDFLLQSMAVGVLSARAETPEHFRVRPSPLKDPVEGDGRVRLYVRRPLQISIIHGRIASIGADLEDYPPAGRFERALPEDDVSIEARLRPTERALKLNRPECQVRVVF